MTLAISNNTNDMQLIVWVSPEEQEKIVKEALARYHTFNELKATIAKISKLINQPHNTQVNSYSDFPSLMVIGSYLLQVAHLQNKLNQILEYFKQNQLELHKVTPSQVTGLKYLSQQIDTLNIIESYRYNENFNKLFESN